MNTVNVKENEKKFNYSLFFSLMLLFFIPAINDTVKVLFVNTTTKSLDIVSNIEWFDLINEILCTGLIIPLYSILNRYIDDKDLFKTKVFHTSLIAFLIYLVFSIIVYINGNLLVKSMTNISIAETTKYLQLETIAFVVGFLFSVFSVVFYLLGKAKYIYALIVTKTVCLVISNALLIPQFGSFGIAYANILTNLGLVICCFIILIKKDFINFSFQNLYDKSMFIDWLKIGAFQGLAILVSNVAYAYMIVRIINEVQEQGNYWIANNFIWGWLLVPIFSIGEIIKRDCKEGYDNLNKKAYIKVMVATTCVWIISIPIWKLIFKGLMGVDDPTTLFYIVIKLLPFYVAYMFSSYIECIFQGLGKTRYCLINSMIINCVYYGAFYILFKAGFVKPSLDLVIYMFGFGMVFSLIIYILLKRIFLDLATNNNSVQ